MTTPFDRIAEATGARTQVQLAQVLGIQQSRISDAKRRGALPDSWLITLLGRFNLNPFWIRTGEGFQYMAPQDAKPV